MKTSKRISALLLAICLLAGMAIPMVSAEATTVTYDFDAKNIADANNVTFSGQTTYLTNAGTVLAEMKAAGLINWQYKATTITTVNYALFSANGYFYGRAGGYQYVAFEIDNPGKGTYELSVNHAVSANGAGGIGVYILPGDTADIANALETDTCVGSYTCYSESEAKKDYNTTNIGHNSKLESTWEVKDDNSYIVVFRLEDYPSGRSRIYLSQLVLTPVAAEKEDEAKIGTESYATLQDAIDNAKSGDEIVLQTAVEADKVQVPLGVTVNLNGKTLTAGEIEIAGALVDTDGNGLLVTNTTITCSSDNGGYLPLSTAGGYKLFKVNTQALGIVEVNAATNAYWFHADFEKIAAYDYYADVKIGAQMTWDGGSNPAQADGDFMEKWATEVKADKDLDIKLTVKGLDTVTNFKLTPVIQANGVTISMEYPA